MIVYIVCYYSVTHVILLEQFDFITFSLVSITITSTFSSQIILHISLIVGIMGDCDAMKEFSPLKSRMNEALMLYDPEMGIFEINIYILCKPEVLRFFSMRNRRFCE